MKNHFISAAAISSLLLCLTLAGCASVPPANQPVQVFNVRAYGALGNGTQLDSPAINRAINAAAAALSIFGLCQMAAAGA